MEKIISALKQPGKVLESLNLTMLTCYDIKGNLNPFYGKKFTSDDIKIIEKEKTIKHIYFDHTSLDDFDLLPNLDLLSLGLSGCPINDDFISRLSGKYPNLQGLYLREVKFDKKLLANFKKLCELEVDYDDIRDVLWLFSENRNLETINGIDYFGNSGGYTSVSECDDESIFSDNSKINK
jgi:hypothetical protein